MKHLVFRCTGTDARKVALDRSARSITLTRVAQNEAGVSGTDLELRTQHQRSVPMPSLASEARTLAEYGAGEDGTLFFSFSGLSNHTKNLAKDGRCSIVVLAPGFEGLGDSRFCLEGTITTVPKDEVEFARQIYLERNPKSFWTDFGDFKWLKLDKDNIRGGLLTSGFGRAGAISRDDYLRAETDPLAAFSKPVASHMNADHRDAVIAMVKHFVGLTVQDAEMKAINKYGFTVACSRQDTPLTCFVPFLRTPESRADLKNVIVEMTRAANSSEN